jgi:tetratricopeptide (TPR) repeat protein
MSRTADKQGISAAAGLHRQAMEAVKAGRLEQGIILLQQALAGSPGSGEIHNDLGTAFWQAGNPAKAEEHYEKAVRLAPKNPYALNNYGGFLLEQLRLDEAEKVLKRAYAIKPDHYQIPNNMGLLHYRRGDLKEAESYFVQAIRLNMSWPNAHANLGNVLRETKRYTMAEQAYKHALRLQPANAAAWNGLGHLYFLWHREAEAEECLQKSITLDPGNEMPWIKLLGLYEKLTRLDDAVATLERVKKLFPGNVDIVIYESKLLRRLKREDEALAVLENFSISVNENSPRGAKLLMEYNYELGELYDRRGDADKAFACFVRSSNCHAGTGEAAKYDKTHFSRLIARLQKDTTPDIFAGPAAPPLADGTPALVFLVGFPRSGTTLLDQILTSHPDIVVAEEKPAVDRMMQRLAEVTTGTPTKYGNFAEYPSCLKDITPAQIEELRAAFFAEHNAKIHGGKKIFVDKLPLNILQAGLIRRVFPSAKFILALRHPCDSVLSCFMQNFQLNAAMVRFLDLEDSARFYDEAFTLWEHYTKTVDFDVHRIRYEDVVADFQPTVAALLKFLGVEWNDAVLEFDKTARERGRINTPSYHQVTQKIYTRASGRWLRYRAHLAPVLDILAPHALRHGYSMEAPEEN